MIEHLASQVHGCVPFQHVLDIDKFGSQVAIFVWDDSVAELFECSNEIRGTKFDSLMEQGGVVDSVQEFPRVQIP